MQDSGEIEPEIEEDSDSELDEEAALKFYRGVEERLKLKRKTKDPEAEGWVGKYCIFKGRDKYNRECDQLLICCRLENEDDDDDDEEEFDPDAKRGITYQVLQ